MGGCDTGLPEHVLEVGIYCFVFALVAGGSETPVLLPRRSLRLLCFQIQFSIVCMFW